jgi:diguanylate cyclase (GGDEF)-like protein
MSPISSFSSILKKIPKGLKATFLPFGKRSPSYSDLRRNCEVLEIQVRDLALHFEEMALFGQLAEMLQACVIAEELCKIVAVFAKALFPEDSGSLYFLETASGLLERQISWGDFPSTGSINFPLADCWALRRSQPHYQEQAQKEIFCVHVAQPLPSFIYCIPLNGQGGSQGLLHLRAGSSDKRLTEPKQLMAVAMAYQVALGLSNLRLRERLREEAIRDPVTGLFNRRFMSESLSHEIAQAKRSGKCLALIAIDLDHFKKVNDSLGHAAGDSLLQGMAKITKANLREGDICCRQGGDEFTLILPDISENDAFALAEKLRRKASRFSLESFSSLDKSVTLSAGLAIFPKDASSAEGLQKIADQALYRAKTLGRDQTFAASQLGENKVSVLEKLNEGGTT